MEPEYQEPWRAGDEPQPHVWRSGLRGLIPDRIETSGSLNVTQEATGRSCRQKRDPITAKLSGTTSPYSWTSQVSSTLGSMVSGPRTGTTNAYEVNAALASNNGSSACTQTAEANYNFRRSRAVPQALHAQVPSRSTLSAVARI